MSTRIKDPSGKVHKVVYIPNVDGFAATAYVRVGLFKKIVQHAAGRNAVDNLVRRLEKSGWEVCP